MLHPILGVSIISSITSSGKVVKNIKGFVPKYNSQGQPKYYAGRNGFLFEVDIDGKQHALKCYTQPQKRGEAICTYIAQLATDRLPTPTFYDQELLIPTLTGVESIDVCTYPWIEGNTLDFEIKRSVYNDNRESLLRLAEEFRLLALDILNSPWRHGDIKPENIIVRPNGKLCLVDVDALWAPSLPPCAEVGTPTFIHPFRGTNRDEHIDDYTIALVLANLHALVHNPAPEVIKKGLLFTAEEALGGHPLFLEAASAVAPNSALAALYEALSNKDSYKIPNLIKLLSDV